MDDHLQNVYDDAFDNAYHNFMLRKSEDDTFDKDFLTGLLESMYTCQGNDWTGRGQVKDMSQSAMIAAAEAVLAAWED